MDRRAARSSRLLAARGHHRFSGHLPAPLTAGLLLAVLLGAALARAAGPATPTVRDDAWLAILRGGQHLGWARERLLQGPGAAAWSVERQTLVGERREWLVATLDESGQPAVTYRREGGGDDAVEVVLRHGRLRWRVGEVGETVAAGPGPAPIPTALLRTLRWDGPRRLLLEEHGAAGPGVVAVHPLPDGRTRVGYRVAGLAEELLLAADGSLLELATPALGVAARRVTTPPPPALRRRLLAPLPPPPAAALPGWQEPTAGLRRLAAELGSTEAVLRYTAAAIRSVADPRYRTADAVRRRGEADCTGRATLAAALLRLLGVESRHVVGRRGPGASRGGGGARWPGHQWLELRQPDGSWRPVDPDGSPVLPATHRPLLRFEPSPRALLAAELALLLDEAGASAPTSAP